MLVKLVRWDSVGVRLWEQLGSGPSDVQTGLADGGVGVRLKLGVKGALSELCSQYSSPRGHT